MSISLDVFVHNLTADGTDKFSILKSYESEVSKQKLLFYKRVCPYDCIDNEQTLTECQLPPKDTFYNLLKETDTSDDDYNHACNVWNLFGCKDLGDYHDI